MCVVDGRHRCTYTLYCAAAACVVIMDPSGAKPASLALSPYSSPNVAALLKIKINAWSQETGLPALVRVRVGDKVFALHKCPLVSKSGYFKKALSESTDILLPHEFPGGAEAFEMVALFSYGASTTLIDPFNVASLRCAAEFLDMAEAYSPGNLCERSDLYLIQVVLQNWEDTLIVLQKCQMLLPMSEQLLIVSRCVESLAFMACMEILDPDRRRERPIVTLESLNRHAWSSEIACQEDLWMNLISLPLRFFTRIVASLRRQGMKEKYVCPIIIFYANKWLLSKEMNKTDDDEASKILQGILHLLPIRTDKASRVIPVGFYLALLSRALHLGFKSETKDRLQQQIATLLHHAVVDDLLFPAELMSSSVELATMESIFSASVLQSNAAAAARGAIIAQLWDQYLSYIATDPKMCPERFVDLIEKVPISHRNAQDHLYRAISTFLRAHPRLSQEDKASVCKYLCCQKLSQETCIEAVQNELMPLRLIVQALFVQQLHTHQAFKDCSDSFRHAHSGSLSGSTCPNTTTQTPPYEAAAVVLLQKDLVIHSAGLSRKDYESTSFRIQNLERQLMSLKRSLQWRDIPGESEPPPKQPGCKTCGLQKRSMGRKRNPIGQVTGCIASVRFASQRKYASRLLKVFRRIALFGISKSKAKPSATSRPKSV